MYRIDDNTYIDDTLVTCAEYQLFIDQMREQGKYYQPDHWISYQFPTGQAHEPIFGVRYADNFDFCKWITEYENNEWLYRLPTQKEALEHAKKLVSYNSAGYWSTSLKIDQLTNKIIAETPCFIWTEGPLLYPINTNIERNLKDGIIIARDFYEDHHLMNRVEKLLHRIAPEDLKNTAFYKNEVNKITGVHIELLADLIMLEKRRRGVSPAFEGIRLVKERIR